MPASGREQPPVFHERLRLRRGPAGWPLLLVSAALAVLPPLTFGDGSAWILAASVGIGAALAIVTWFACT